MNSYYQDIDLIERFLKNELDQREMELVNTRLGTDSSFNRLFSEMNHLINGINHTGKYSTLEEKLGKLEKALPSKKKREINVETTIIPAWDWILQNKRRVAAMISPLIIASIVIIHLNTPKTPSDLFSTYFDYYDSQGGYIYRGDTDKKQLQRAFWLYDQGEYEEAQKIFDRIPINDENKIIIWMYAGNAHLGQGNTGNAIPMFQRIIRENTGFVIQAKWYLGLCYLMEEELEKSVTLLDEVRMNGKFKSEEAGRILNRIRK